jgi:rod shape-determining protein MreD
VAVYLGLAVGFLGALLQSTVLSEYGWLGAHPDLVVVAVAGWAALRRIEDGLVWALIGGIALDLFSAGPFGLSVLGLIVAALIAWLLGQRLRPYNQILVVASVPFAAFAYYLVATLVLAIGGAAIEPLPLVLSVIGPAIALDTLIGPIVLFALAWASHAITPAPWAPQ